MSSVPIADQEHLSFEITNKGKMALAWEDRVKPTVHSSTMKDGIPLVQASLGADIELIEREDGVEVGITRWPDDEPGIILVGIAWAHGNRLNHIKGAMTVAQLKELFEVLGAALDEAARVGLLTDQDQPTDVAALDEEDELEF